MDRIRSTTLWMLTVLLLSACAPAGRVPQSNPVTAEHQDPTLRPPEPLSVEALAVTLTVDGVLISTEHEFVLDHGNAIAITLTFTRQMVRPSVEGSLRAGNMPKGSIFTWQDDQHLRIDIAEAGSFSINLNGVVARDGTRLDQIIRRIVRPLMLEVAIFTLADLREGKELPTRLWTFSGHMGGFRLGPDGRTALLYPTMFESDSKPELLDLATGKRIPLGLPEGKNLWYSDGGWLPDGRIYIVGAGAVWIGRPGAAMRSIGKAFVWITVPSPSGRYLALWGPTASGDVMIVDLQTETLTQIPGPFRRGVEDGGVTLGWSPDERFLAGTDFDNENRAGMKIRIIDPHKPENVRTIPDLGFTAWLPDGSILGVRYSGGGEIPYRSVILDTTGKETPFPEEFIGVVTPSPDGRYLLYNAYKLNYGITDLQTGARLGLNFPGVPRWTPTVDLVTIRRLPAQ